MHKIHALVLEGAKLLLRKDVHDRILKNTQLSAHLEHLDNTVWEKCSWKTQPECRGLFIYILLLWILIVSST